MLEKTDIQFIRQQLFKEPETDVYAVLDGASVPDLPQVLWEQEPQYVCLYRGKLEPDMAEVAPYLVRLESESPFTDWVIGQGWGNHWGIFALTPEQTNLTTMRKHFRTFLMVRGPDGRRLYFRYYDPRVLRVYLPTCKSEEREIVFGPIRNYVMESEDSSGVLCISSNGERILRRRVAP